MRTDSVIYVPAVGGFNYCYCSTVLIFRKQKGNSSYTVSKHGRSGPVGVMVERKKKSKRRYYGGVFLSIRKRRIRVYLFLFTSVPDPCTRGKRDNSIPESRWEKKNSKLNKNYITSRTPSRYENRRIHLDLVSISIAFVSNQFFL